MMIKPLEKNKEERGIRSVWNGGVMGCNLLKGDQGRPHCDGKI